MYVCMYVCMYACVCDIYLCISKNIQFNKIKDEAEIFIILRYFGSSLFLSTSSLFNFKFLIPIKIRIFLAEGDIV